MCYDLGVVLSNPAALMVPPSGAGVSFEQRSGLHVCTSPCVYVGSLQVSPSSLSASSRSSSNRKWRDGGSDIDLGAK